MMCQPKANDQGHYVLYMLKLEPAPRFLPSPARTSTTVTSTSTSIRQPVVFGGMRRPRILDSAGPFECGKCTRRPFALGLGNSQMFLQSLIGAEMQ